MWRGISIVAVSGLCVTSCLAPVWADGGTVRLVERHGNRTISVFTSPNPLRAPMVDVSVLVQDATTGEAIHDAVTIVQLTPADGTSPEILAAATNEAATNKLLQSALVELPTAGTWNVTVRSDARGEMVIARFSMTARPALPQWRGQWTWFSWPIVAVLLFGLHRTMAARLNAKT